MVEPDPAAIAAHRDVVRGLATPGGPLAADSPHSTMNNPAWFDPATGFTPERRSLHRRIIAEHRATQPDVRQDRLAVVLAGPPGAGKSTALKRVLGSTLTRYLHVDADDFKAALLEEARRDGTTAKDRRMKVYRQPTLVLPASVATKLRQEHRWGSDAWISDYSRRTAIEAVFGNMKARDGEGVQRGWIRLVGLVPTALMTAFAIVHYNLRMVRKWAKRTGFQSEDILLARDRAIAGYEEVPLDDDEPSAALSPPVAA